MNLQVLGFALVGLVVGSFLNVVIHRVPRKLSIAFPPSSCPKCGAPISVRDNIPLVGFLLLRGRCRACGDGISARYPLVELATAALFAVAGLKFELVLDAAYVSAGFAVLLAIAVIDLDFKIVPNVIVVPSTLVFLVFNLATLRVSSLQGSLVLGGVVLLIAMLARGGLGMGDVKLAAFIGAFAGRFSLLTALSALWMGVVVGGVVGIALLASGKASRKQVVPYAPMLAAGAFLAVLVGDVLVSRLLGF